MWIVRKTNYSNPRYGAIFVICVALAVGCSAGDSNNPSNASDPAIQNPPPQSPPSSTSDPAFQNPPPQSPPSQSPPPSPGARIYVTDFALNETVISENGNWVNGRKHGEDWSDVATAGGLAIGTQSGSGQRGYDDSTALLTGPWAPNQTVVATVHSVNPNSSIFEEVEIRLRSTLSAHSCTGYEVLFRAFKGADSYAQIVRWNGPNGDFTYLDSRWGEQFGVTEGDIVKASIVGNVITAYINDVQVLQATDDTYSSGSPGMGFWLGGQIGLNADYGFVRFTASDGP